MIHEFNTLIMGNDIDDNILTWKVNFLNPFLRDIHIHMKSIVDKKCYNNPMGEELCLCFHRQLKIEKIMIILESKNQNLIRIWFGFLVAYKCTCLKLRIMIPENGDSWPLQHSSCWGSTSGRLVNITYRYGS